MRFKVGDFVRVKRLADPRRDLLYHGFIGEVKHIRNGKAWVDTDGYPEVQAVTFRDWFALSDLDALKDAGEA